MRFTLSIKKSFKNMTKFPIHKYLCKILVENKNIIYLKKL